MQSLQFVVLERDIAYKTIASRRHADPLYRALAVPRDPGHATLSTGTLFESWQGLGFGLLLRIVCKHHLTNVWDIVQEDLRARKEGGRQ